MSLRLDNPYGRCFVVAKGRESLGDFVRRIRQEKKLSLAEVQAQAKDGIARSHVSRIENGEADNLSTEKLKALAEGLGVSEDEIFAIARGQAGVGELSLKEARLIDSYRRLASDRQEIALGMMDVLCGGTAGMRHPAVTDTPADFPLPETTPEDLGEEEEDKSGWLDSRAANGKNGTDS